MERTAAEERTPESVYAENFNSQYPDIVSMRMAMSKMTHNLRNWPTLDVLQDTQNCLECWEWIAQKLLGKWNACYLSATFQLHLERMADEWSKERGQKKTAELAIETDLYKYKYGEHYTTKLN